MPSEEEEGGGIDFRRYLLGIWRFKWLVLLAAVLGGAVGLGLAYLQSPEYRAQSTLWVEVTDRDLANAGPIRSQELLRSTAWEDLLRSFEVLDYAVREGRLYVEPANMADSAAFRNFQMTDSGDLRPGRYTLSVADDGSSYILTARGGSEIETRPIGRPVGAAAGFRWAPPRETLQPGESLNFTVKSMRQASVELAGQLDPRMSGNGSFMMLRLSGEDPVRTATTLNAVTERFVEVAADLKRARLDELTGVLDEQLQTTQQNLANAERSLEDFRVRTIAMPSEQDAGPVAAGLQMTRGPAFQSHFQLTSERDQIARDRREIQRIVGQAGSAGLSLHALEAIPSVQGSSAVPSALGALSERQAELRAMEERYTDEYPPLQRVRREVREMETQTIPNVASRLDGELAERQEEISRELGSSTEELQRIPPRAIEEARLERSMNTAENLYTAVLGRYENARLAAESSVPDLRILDRASPPTTPTQDQRAQLVLLSLLGGLALGVAGVLLLERTDPKLRYPNQVTGGMGLSMLGIVPDLGRGKGRKSRQDAVATQAVEAFREIRLNLWHAHGRGAPLVTAVTSPGSGDGKSFVTTNLALAFADHGHRTLLIDGDVRRGTLHMLLNGARTPGLVDYLDGNASADEIIQKMPRGSLDLISRGTARRQAPELLGSDRMEELVDSLRSRYQVILIDSPPVGAGVDPLALGTVAGNLVFVLRTGNSDRDFASSKLEALHRLPIRLLGTVLNGVSMNRFEGYYPYIEGYEAVDEVSPAEEDSRQLTGV